jgi:hypothetical protein
MSAKPTEKPRKSKLPHPARRALALLPSATRFASPQVARFVPAKAVGSFVPTLTKKAFEKFGFSTATLLTDWERIVGAEIAGYTVPERLKWPRTPQGDYAEEEAARPGATLILRVDPARALDVEYRARQITDRINAYFGYRAVETLRIVQAPVAQGKSVSSSANIGSEVSLRCPPESILGASAGPTTEDEQLRAALARLEKGILRDKATTRRS